MILAKFSNIFRYLRKTWVSTIINVVGLAFGFTCAILILLHVAKENSYNDSIPENERVFNLLQKTPDSPLGGTSISYALSPLLAEHFPEIEYFARTENYSWFSNCIVSYQPSGETDLLSFNEPDFYLADPDLFQIIQYPFIEGSRENALKDPNSIVLSENTAEKYFGNASALGKTLVLNNNQSFVVSGVVDFPDYTTFRFSMLAPMTTVRSESKLAGWDSNGQPFFKLHKNIYYKEFNKKIEHFYSELNLDDISNPEQLTLSLLPITERHLYYNKNPLYLLIFIGIVVLIVSVLNYVNMSTSMVHKRRSEIALKKISGASKKVIARQFIWETLLIGFMAVLLGGILAIIGTPVFRMLVGSNVQPFLKAHIGFFIIGSVCLWLITSILAGFYPSIILSGVKPLVLFRKEGKTKVGLSSKNILITFQFVISIILVIITLMVDRQYRYMENMSLGFDNKMVLQIPFTNQLKDNYTNLKNELKQNPSVKDVCAASSMPAGIPNHSGVSWVDDQGLKHEESFGFAIVSDGYTQTFDMTMSLGNEFKADRPDELKGLIINETAAKRLGVENPIGKLLHFWGKDNLVIGVVKDFQNNYLFNTVKPMIISARPENQGFTKFLFVSLFPGQVDRTINRIEKTIKEISPDFPFEYSFTNAEVQGYINEIKEINLTFRFASIVSIVLAIIGLVALTYHATQARIKEIGIRKVNGAKNIEIINLLNNSLLRSVIIAFVVASPIAWLIIFNLLKSIGNKTNIAWWVFVLAGAMVGIIAVITVTWQSWQAATRNPVEALRYE
ncbi:ABC transporter permease [Sunxiuqinia sp. A32]|uniref:ABC transporter permease n=1 Tax=Sunxiuqinia sp. A32 TaxID=3461496 RepID=UPI004045B09F